MAAATLAQIREGLRVRLATIPNVQTSAYMLGQVTPPTLQVMGPDEVQYDLAFHRGLDQWTLIVQGFVGAVADVGAQTNLDLWLAPSGSLSVKAAIEGDRSAAGALGGLVQDLTVTTSSGYRIYQLDNSGPVLGAEWTVSVLNTGT